MDTKADSKGIELNDDDEYDYDDDISSLSLDGNLLSDGERSLDDDASSGDELLSDDVPSSELLEEYIAGTKAAHKIATHEPEHELHLVNSLNNESVGVPAFNVGESADNI
ncbi:hypothetical protein BDZ45DRAFT_739092 [Acephala macrosclerotiorum]|nr:hypothetical protein BDZ45DRAFT_739092 [Acephala macrosclerotiorum]